MQRAGATCYSDPKRIMLPSGRRPRELDDGLHHLGRRIQRQEMPGVLDDAHRSPRNRLPLGFTFFPPRPIVLAVDQERRTINACVLDTCTRPIRPMAHERHERPIVTRPAADLVQRPRQVRGQSPVRCTPLSKIRLTIGYWRRRVIVAPRMGRLFSPNITFVNPELLRRPRPRSQSSGLIATTERTRGLRRAARSSAIIPPMDSPTTTASRISSCFRNRATDGDQAHEDGGTHNLPAHSTVTSPTLLEIEFTSMGSLVDCALAILGLGVCSTRNVRSHSGSRPGSSPCAPGPLRRMPPGRPRG